MENNQLSVMDLLLETHIGLKRQGPGSPESVKRALEFLKPWSRFERIADLGCGTGGGTMILAEYLPGKIVGLDMFPDFVDRFNEISRRKGWEERVSAVVGNMENLPFQRESFDLIWSEGAIDGIGFEKGIRHWHDFLKTGGYIAVTCPSWITSEQPAVVEKFWSEAGSHLDSVGNNIEIMQKCGYQFIASFTLPEECWTEHYFIPREAEISRLLEKYAGHDIMIEYAKENRYEAELYSKFHLHYGYVFYIGKAV